MDIVEKDSNKDCLNKFEKAVNHWRDIYKFAKEDLHFQSDDPEAQWDSEDYQARVGAKRPIITVNMLPQFVNQVANNVRMNTPTINIIPADGADEETAEIIKGLVKYIEYHSNADDAYDTACLNAIKCSIGFIRVNHKWKDESETEQELTIERVVNPLAVYLDPYSVTPDGSDAKYAFVLDKISVGDFKEKYPDKEPTSFEVDWEKPGEIDDDDEIQIVEYFYIKDKVVYREVRSGTDILEESTFPGDYIPLIPVYGEEAWEDGKRCIKSLIRNAKEPQRMYNYWKSMEVELLQKQPRAKWVVVNGSLEGYEEDWTEADSTDVLSYNQKDANGDPVPAPFMIPPPQIPTGIVNAQRQAVDDIKAAMGIYNAALGAASNETSGIAINARKVESQVTTYHYGDNLVRSITQVGRVLVSAIKVVYDTARIIRTVAEDNQVKPVGINGQIVEGQERDYNLTQGNYDVRVTTGAAYTTLRQESATFFKELLAQRPDLTNVIGDIAFESMDIPGASAIAKRLKKTIDPKLLEGDNQAPQVMAMQEQLMQAQQIIEQLQMGIQELEQSKEAEIMETQAKLQMEAQKDQSKTQIDLMKLQYERDKAQAELEIKRQELELKRLEIGLKNEVENDKIELQQEKLISEILARVRSELHEIGMNQSFDNGVNATQIMENEYE